MPKEKLIFEPVVLSIPVHYPELTDPDCQASEGARLRAFFSDIVGLDPTFPLLVGGLAHGVLPGSSAGGDSGSFCDLRTNGGCKGRIVLAPLEPDHKSHRITLNFKLVKGQGDQGWLTLSFNSTTIIAGDNVHPASLPDPDTGEIVGWPSSSLAVVGLFFRLGFFVSELLFQQMTGSGQRLFDPATWARIEEGAVHIVSTQNCAYLPSPNVSKDLKGLTVLFGQTIATGMGIINLATLLGLNSTGPTSIRTPTRSRRFWSSRPRGRSRRSRSPFTTRMRAQDRCVSGVACPIRRRRRWTKTFGSTSRCTALGLRPSCGKRVCASSR